MDFLDIFMIGVGLSMDAFAVSVCKGLSVKKVTWKNVLTCAVYFGGFQALMPTIGYLLGANFASLVDAVDHWIAFVMLAVIGGNMIRESFGEEELDDDFSMPTMIGLAVATAIDALAVGVSFSFMKGVVLLPAVTIIGCTTFVIAGAGVLLGHKFGARLGSRAEMIGGIILIIIGLRILINGLM